MKGDKQKININVYADLLTRVHFTNLPFVKNILDLGAGNCILHETYPYTDTRITFTDLAKSDNATFQRKKQYLENLDRYDFVETPCYDLSMFDNNSFEMVMFSHVIEHLTETEIEKTMNEINRVLTKDGMLILLTPNKTGRILLNKYKKHTGHVEEFTGKELMDIVNKYGFNVINDNKGIISIIKDGDIYNVIPKVTDDIDLSYVLFFMCKKQNGVQK